MSVVKLDSDKKFIRDLTNLFESHGITNFGLCYSTGEDCGHLYKCSDVADVMELTSMYGRLDLLKHAFRAYYLDTQLKDT